jgi:hypothetical protein
VEKAGRANTNPQKGKTDSGVRTEGRRDRGVSGERQGQGVGPPWETNHPGTERGGDAGDTARVRKAGRANINPQTGETDSGVRTEGRRGRVASGERQGQGLGPPRETNHPDGRAPIGRREEWTRQGGTLKQHERTDRGAAQFPGRTPDRPRDAAQRHTPPPRRQSPGTRVERAATTRGLSSGISNSSAPPPPALRQTGSRRGSVPLGVTDQLHPKKRGFRTDKWKKTKDGITRAKQCKEQRKGWSQEMESPQENSAGNCGSARNGGRTK